MVGVIDSIVNVFSGAYSGLKGMFPGNSGLAVQIVFFAVLIAIVAVFIWKFYKSLSQKDLISLNLSQYNHSQHPLFSKLIAIGLFLVEYLIIMPILILLWFTALSVILLLIAEEGSVAGVLLLTAAMVSAVRILAYFRKEISQDLAKLFPFITLSVFLLTPGAFDAIAFFEKLKQIPSLLGSILVFLLVVVCVEIVLRLFYTIFQFWESEDQAAVAEQAESVVRVK
jgi:hypothetical protein